MIRFIGRLSLVCVFLAGCSQQLPDRPSEPHEHSQNLREELRHSEMHRDRNRFIDPARAAVPVALNVSRYRLEGEMDWTRRTLAATVHIRLQVTDSSAPSLTLDSYVTRIVSVKLTTGEPLPFSTATEGKLEIDLKAVSKAVLVAPFEIQVQYEAKADALANGNPSALVTVIPRKGDPNPSRITYTHSEPYGASEWMPCHNDPRDRAEFATDFSMDSHERLIANGALSLDKIDNGRRRMQYATSYPLPTYLMAFAIGEFSIYHRQLGKLPLSLWVRKGIPVEGDKLLQKLAASIQHFESLLIPYPFEKYALVLLPEFPSGGLENAGITFQAEVKSSQPEFSGDTGLTDHELAHQWFGDYLSVETWDDLWIKEGMASLLGEEATRAREDKNKAHRLFGSIHSPVSGEAIRDKGLKPDDKYTSGPYDRAAWWLTQVRSVIGETAFWGTLRSILQSHAFGNIGTDEFVEAFRPHLGDALFAKAKAAVDAKALPTWIVKENSSNQLSIELKDAEGVLIKPVDLTVYSVGGDEKKYELPSTGALTIDVPADSFIAFDSTDTHSMNAFDDTDDSFEEHLSERLIPPAALHDKFLQLAAGVPTLALSKDGEWNLEPRDVVSFVSRLPADSLHYLATQRICEAASQRAPKTGIAQWLQPIGRILLSTNLYGIPSRAPKQGYAACSPFVDKSSFSFWWNAMKDGIASPFLNETLVIYLAVIPQTPAEALDTWTPLLKSAYSIRTQMTALHALIRHVTTKSGFEQVTADKDTGFRAAFRNALVDNDAAEVRLLALEGILKMKDTDSLALVAKAIRRNSRPWFQLEAVCGVHKGSTSEPALWQRLVSELGDLSDFSDRLQATIADPAVKCNY